MDDRIIELEKKSAFQEDTIEALNQVIIEQQKRLDRVEKRLKFITDQLEGSDLIKKLEDEAPPPHY